MNLPPATQRLALLLPLGLTMASGIAGPGHAADSACLYQSRSYSEGAYICVQRSLMQTCASDGSRMTWRIVADRDLSERCTAPLTYAEPRRRIVHRARIVRPAAAPAVAPAEPASAKCFVFNGKRYCE